MNTANEYQDDSYNSAYNPFPEPQTIPSGWDMSEFTSATEVNAIMDEDDSTES